MADGCTPVWGNNAFILFLIFILIIFGVGVCCCRGLI